MAQSSPRVALPEHQDVVKFLCDRCKTRYSIGDDRVRGKILKIRCKNCANVITVREGMPDADAADSGGTSRPRTATQANPVVMSSAAVSAPMPAAPKLEDEWYVSIDGVQSGPFALKTAQQWVSSKPFEAELHCWCEGFDDWLPVDKVSHFRNLRKPRPVRQPTAPPPIPKPEKPLFASTMASLEKAASTPAMPAAQPKTNGSNAAASMFDAEPDSRTTVGSPAFESESADPFFSAKATPAAKPVVPAKPAAAAKPVVAAKPTPAKVSLEELKAPVKPIHNDDDDNLEIGEVSRVVKLADLMPKPASQPLQVVPPGGTGPMPRISQTGAVARIGGNTGVVPRMGATASMQKLTPAELGMNVNANVEPNADESVVARSYVERHRRGLMLLIGVSALMVAGVVLLFVFVVNNNNDEYGGGLGGTRQIDTTRPEDIVRKQAGLPPTNAGSAAITQIQKNPIRRPTGGNNNNTQIEEPDNSNSLRASEIEDMAAKQGEGTKRCYMRAQRGALGFEIAEVKKINVTLTVGKNGIVTAVDLSSHANDTFGQCLISQIKAWKFRESNGGTFRISLAFSAG